MDNTGLLIEAAFVDNSVEPDAIAALVGRAVQLGSHLAEDLGKGSLNQQYIEYADCQITAEQLAGECVLVVVARANANLGRLRLEIRKSKSAIEAMLA
jgi:predicted regulator of Ras-like GTPase activity (Roadblock/LC7/MglB family)